MPDWAGKSVVITGASGGLGQALVAEFYRAGAQVVAVSRSIPPETFKGVDYRSADLTDEASVRDLFGSLTAPWAVINTVGGFAPYRPFSEFDVAEFEQQQALNLKSAVLLTKYALQAMEPVGAGRIIHTASRAATHPAGAGFAYSVSKVGVLHLVQMVAAEYAQTDIRIHAVNPAIIYTPANRAAMPDADHSAWAQPSDLARAYLFLATANCPAKSGTILPV